MKLYVEIIMFYFSIVTGRIVPGDYGGLIALVVYFSKRINVGSERLQPESTCKYKFL